MLELLATPTLHCINVCGVTVLTEAALRFLPVQFQTFKTCFNRHILDLAVSLTMPFFVLQQTQQELPAGPPEAAAGDAAAATEAGPATAAEPGSRAAGADVAAAVADENASLRAQLAAALLQLAAATPRRAPRSPRNPQASPPGADSDMTATASPWSTSGDLPSAAAMHGNVDSTAAGDGSRGGSRFGGGVGPGSPPMSALRPFSLHLASPLGGFSPMRAGGYNSEYEVSLTRATKHRRRVPLWPSFIQINRPLAAWQLILRLAVAQRDTVLFSPRCSCWKPPNIPLVCESTGKPTNRACV